MRTLRFLTVASFAALVGCAPGQMMNGDDTGQWEAMLVPEAGFVGLSGEATVAALEWGATATVRVEGAGEAGSHAWAIYRGECGDQGQMVGSDEAYPAIEVSAEGAGEATAMVDENLEPGESYHVAVHPSPEERGSVVACGDLLRTEVEAQPAEDWDDPWDDTTAVRIR